jgi:glutamate dehydrogenase
MDERQKPEPAVVPAAAAAVRDELDRHLGTEGAAAAAAFTDLLYANSNGAFDSKLASDNIAALAASAFHLLRDKRDQPFVVRVYHPQLETHGWTTQHCVVEAILDDQPHIVDTLCEALQAKGGEVELLLNPLIDVERDARGALLSVGAPKSTKRAVQLFHAHVANLAASPDLEDALRHHLLQLHRVTQDGKALRERLSQLAMELDGRLPEGPGAAAFLRWLGQGNFALLGYDEAPPGGTNALGILRDDGIPYAALGGDAPDPLAVVRTSVRSPVQRLAYLDEIRIRRASGGECRFVGMFLANAYRQSAGEIPSFRRRFEQILATLRSADGFEPNVVGAMFDRLPIEIVAGSTTDQLYDLIRAQHAAEVGTDFQLHCHVDRFGRNAFFTVFLPRKLFSPDSLGQVCALLEREVGPVLGSHVVHDDRPTVRIHLLAAAAAAPSTALTELASRLQAALCRRDEGRRDAGTSALANAGSVWRTPSAARPRALHLDPATPDVRKDAVEIHSAGRGRFVLRICAAPDSLVLSELLPLLQNLGLLVLRQDAKDLSADASEHAFTVEASRGAVEDLGDLLPALLETLRAVRAGNIANDPLNALTLRARLPWRSINLLRSYVEYAAQIDAAPRDLATRSLAEHVDCATALVELFAAKFDARLPIVNPAQRKREIATAAARFAGLCEQVESSDRREILRTLAALVEATDRTNAYLPEAREAAAPAIVIKIDPHTLAGSVASACRSETYVHAAAYEAIVLRAGAVAHVELTLANRLDHLRAQAVARLCDRSLQSFHNVALAGIGTVFLKNAAPSRASQSEVSRVLRELAAVLLSITDNVSGDSVVPPRDLLTYDEIDPYLVLLPGAIEPGLTDALGEISLERGYWLEDAFCAGGVNGLSTRRLAVGTAGAWESARQHYREIGRDFGRERIDAIGVGGPAELRLSPAVHLFAAFDRQHIFIDPDPDPRESFEERQRLAHELEASWSDYNPRRLSRGGAILPRTGRQIQLSPEARALLGFGDEDARFSGADIVRAILRHPAEILWCAAPGASIRLPVEMQTKRFAADIDAVHISPAELRVRTVIECGAAAFTPAARVAFDVAGGRISGPIVDGAAAAALTDREVTLKIALRGARAQRPIDLAERDQALSHAAREIGEELSQGCRRLALALSVDRARSATRLAEFCDLIDALGEEGFVDRERDALASRDEAQARPGGRSGLTQPELAILAAAAKLRLRAAILDSSLCEDLRLQPWIEEHFPAAVRDQLRLGLATHPLRHEIAALEISRRLVDTMGATFVERACRFTGRSPADTAKAWTTSYLLGRGEDLLAELARERDGVRAEDEVAAHLAVAQSLERATLELLQTQATEASLSKLVDRLTTAVAELLQSWPDRLASVRRRAYDRRVDAFTAAGYSTAAADSIVRVASLQEIFLICDVAIRANASRAAVCEAFLTVDRLFDLTWLEEALESTASDSPWEAGARHALRTDLATARRELTCCLLDARSAGASADEMVAEYSSRRAAGVERVRQRLAAVATQSPPTLAGLVVVVHELARLAAR